MEPPLDDDERKEHNNIIIIYDYTQYRIKLTNDSINALNTKLSAVLGFSGVSIFFSINLPNQPFLTNSIDLVCYSCLLLKVSVSVALAIAICIAIQGFRPKAVGGMTPPRILMNEYYHDSEENCRLVITKTWLEALDEFEAMRDIKSKIADRSIISLCIAACLAVSDIVLAALLSIF